ncbi:hypothetical protein Anapl_02823 [Anas platyrhynchos]|uniref:Uncharacterized protein n=1 Tax=Anas platyrhynchos TaxID=8839 RepID=R0LEA3_ANAPL|nr:hypothetical protein Anapl_02823 [Anas platyrhynchos]
MTTERQLRNNVHTSKRGMNLHKTSISTGSSLVPVWVYRNMAVGSHHGHGLYYFSKTNLLLARMYHLQTVSQITVIDIWIIVKVCFCNHVVGTVIVKLHLSLQSVNQKYKCAPSATWWNTSRCCCKGSSKHIREHLFSTGIPNKQLAAIWRSLLQQSTPEELALCTAALTNVKAVLGTAFVRWQPHDAQLRGIMHGVRQHKRALCDVITTPGTDVGSDNRICTNTGTLDAHEMLAEYAHLLFGFTILCKGLNTLWIHPDSDLCHTLVHPERIQIRIYILSSTTSRKQQKHFASTDCDGDFWVVGKATVIPQCGVAGHGAHAVHSVRVAGCHHKGQSSAGCCARK